MDEGFVQRALLVNIPQDDGGVITTGEQTIAVDKGECSNTRAVFVTSRCAPTTPAFGDIPQDD
jgi:hypothetical protein